MSLITRCPACGTMFKVVTDQLKVSQGWVRCGHCSDVFDASLNLQAGQVPPPPVDSQQDVIVEQPYAAPPVWQPEPLPAENSASWTPGVFFAEPPPPAQVFTSVNTNITPGGFVSHPDTREVDVDIDEWPSRSSPVVDGPTSTGWNDPQYEGEPAIDQQDTRESGDNYIANDALPLAAPDAAADSVSFVRDARRRAFWRKPAVRVALGLVGLLLAALLLLQVLVQQKDSMAAMEPTLKPVLQQVCAYLNCQVQPLRRIEAVVIDGSSFNKVNADSYQLGFSLKNNGPVSLAMPYLEVTLTDMQEQAVVRRVLSPAQFGAANRQLAASSDFSALVVMQVAGSGPAAVPTDIPASAASPASAAPPSTLRVAGYRVLAFYP